MTRTFVRRVHLWLGLSIGGLFAFAGLTGSALVFYPELDAAFNPALRAVRVDARPASWQAVVDVLHREHPTRTGAWRIEVPEAGGAIPVRYYKPRETADRDFAPLLVWIDPLRMTTVRSGFWGATFFTFLYDLHYRLLLQEPGGVAMGAAGIVMLMLLASGVWAWWPRGGGWWRSLRVKRGAVAIRRLYDWHKLSGLGGLGVLAVITATGVLLDLPDQTRPVVSLASPLYEKPAMVVVPRGAAMPADRSIAVAVARFPDGVPTWIETPATPAAPIRINLWRPGEPSRRFPRSNVWIDPYSGRVIAVRDGLAESGGDTLLNWLHPLHGGAAFGPIGRWTVFIAGLVPSALFVTGVLRWQRRRRRITARK